MFRSIWFFKMASSSTFMYLDNAVTDLWPETFIMSFSFQPSLYSVVIFDARRLCICHLLKSAETSFRSFIVLIWRSTFFLRELARLKLNNLPYLILEFRSSSLISSIVLIDSTPVRKAVLPEGILAMPPFSDELIRSHVI